VLKAQSDKHPFSLIEEEIGRFLRCGWVEMIRKVFGSGFYDNWVIQELLIIPSFPFFLPWRCESALSKANYLTRQCCGNQMRTYPEDIQLYKKIPKKFFQIYKRGNEFPFSSFPVQ